MSYSNRIFLYGPLGVLLAFVAGVCVLWWVEADQIDASLTATKDKEIAPGIVLGFAEKSIGGFPFRLDIVLTGASLTEHRPDGDIAWRGEKLVLHALTYLRGQYILEAAGLQSLTMPSGNGAPLTLAMTASAARASAIMRDGGLVRFDLDLWQPQAKDTSPTADVSRTFVADRTQLHLMARANDTIAVAVKVDGAQIGAGFKPVFGANLSLLDLRGDVTQSHALSSLAAGHQSVPDAAETWRLAGGKFDIQKLDLNWGAVKTTMTGTLALDPSHELAGAISGLFDAAAAMKAITHGALNLSGMGTTKMTFIFQDGGIMIGAGALSGGASGGSH